MSWKEGSERSYYRDQWVRRVVPGQVFGSMRVRTSTAYPEAGLTAPIPPEYARWKKIENGRSPSLKESLEDISGLATGA